MHTCWLLIQRIQSSRGRTMRVYMWTYNMCICGRTTYNLCSHHVSVICSVHALYNECDDKRKHTLHAVIARTDNVCIFVDMRHTIYAVITWESYVAYTPYIMSTMIRGSIQCMHGPAQERWAAVGNIGINEYTTHMHTCKSTLQNAYIHPYSMCADVTWIGSLIRQKQREGFVC